jgi:hypothetical protein
MLYIIIQDNETLFVGEMKMAMIFQGTKKVNYTAEATAKIIADYQAGVSSRTDC